MGLSNGAIGILEENTVSGSGGPGIAVNGATALKLNRNNVTGADASGILIINGAKVLEMLGNAAYANRGPRFMLRDSTIADPDG
jgi:parallel beta-helix repeat protein